MDGNSILLYRFDRDLSEGRIVHVSGRNVRHDRPIIKGIGPTACAIHKLVTDDKVFRGNVSLKRARSAGADDCLHAELLHRPNVGAIGDFVRWKCVPASMSR